MPLLDNILDGMEAASERETQDLCPLCLVFLLKNLTYKRDYQELMGMALQ
jgi:hypothetical protein